MKAPRELDIFADVVLNYHPATQQKKSGKRKKRAEKKAAKKANDSVITGFGIHDRVVCFHARGDELSIQKKAQVKPA